MFDFRRGWLLCGVVLVGVVALNGVVNGVVDAKAAPAPRAVCVRGGATAIDGVSGRGLVCVQTTARGLRWRFQPTAVTTTTTTSPTTTTTTTVSGVVAPVLVSVSASDDVRVTVAGMRPDTGVYSLQWVPYGQTFNTYQMARATSPSMSVPAGWFACNRTYTFRVFVMQAGWQLADGHQTQNVTPHSTPFDVVMPACPAAATTTTTTTIAPASCATGGVCIVGDTGPGGGIVFYVQASGGTFTSTGSDCGTTCKYLEAATSDQSTGIVWATTDEMCYNPDNSNNGVCQTTSVYEGSDAARISSRAASKAIGKGMANTENFAGRLAGYPQNSTNFAAGIARTYVNNGKTDWHLPSKDELNQMCKWQRGVAWTSDATVCTGGTLNSGPGASGFSGSYWSSSEYDAYSAWLQDFDYGDQVDVSKGTTNEFSPYYVRPVRAF